MEERGDLVSCAPLLRLGPPLRPRIKILKPPLKNSHVSDTLEAELFKIAGQNRVILLLDTKFSEITRRSAALKVEAECLCGAVRL